MTGRNVLIFHAGALGDFVVAWPLMMALSRLHPQSRIICVAAGSKGKLAERALRIESADMESGWHALFGDAGLLPETARRSLENAHSVYTFIASAGDAWCANVGRIAPGAQVIAIAPRPVEGVVFDGHITQWIAGQLESVPAARAALDQIMRSVRTRGIGVRRSPEGVVLIHPGSGSGKKNWPAAHFLQLARKLIKARHRVRVLIGEVEKAQMNEADLDHFTAIADVVAPVDYLELMEQLAMGDALVCNDTGPGHLAGMIGTPTFALFGPESDAKVWAPIGPHVHVIETKDLAHLAADVVLEKVLAVL